VLVLGALLGTGATGAAAPEPPPNVVLLLADDLGFDDLGIHGNTVVETPARDRLARQSVRFSSFYVTPVCAPTRAALLTGRHPLRTEVSHVGGGKNFVDLGETVFSRILGEGSPPFVRRGSRYAPRVVEAPADVTDLFPTILEPAGVGAASARPLDGRSLVAFLEGRGEDLEGRGSSADDNANAPGWRT